jgi:hypothetical protein
MAQAARAQTYTDYIDEFTVTKNSSTIFDDLFNDGNPPPSAPNTSNGPISYLLNGTMGPEVNNPSGPGKLTIDSSGAVHITNAIGVPVLAQLATLPTNIDPNNTTLGLKSNSTFSVTGVFDLVVPPPTTFLSGYGVTLSDNTAPTGNTANDYVQMRVVMTSSNQLEILLDEQDFVSHTFTFIESTPLVTSSSYNQIALTLTRGDVSSDAVTGSFYYLDSGVPVVGSLTTFADTASIFSDDNFTRAGFSAGVAVPEPSAMLFLVPGLVALVGVRRRLKK